MKIFFMIYFSIGIILGILSAVVLTRKEVKQFFIDMYFASTIFDHSLKIDDDFDYDKYTKDHEEDLNEMYGFIIALYEILIIFGWHLLVLWILGYFLYGVLKDRLEK